MDKGITMLLCKLIGMLTGFIINISVKNNLSTIALGSVDFDKRRCRRHNDNRLYSIALCRIGNTLCMVSCGGCDQSLFPFLFGQGTQLIVSTSELIGTCKLHVFRFQIYLIPGLCTVKITVNQLGLLGNLLNDL